MEQFASTYMELGFAGIVAALFGFMIVNKIKTKIGSEIFKIKKNFEIFGKLKKNFTLHFTLKKNEPLFLIAKVRVSVPISSQNAQNEDLERIKQDLMKLSTEMSNTQSIAVKIVDRFNLTDRTSQSHREAVVKELNELSQDIAEVKGSVSRINGRH